jgi:hypothetical protein
MVCHDIEIGARVFATRAIVATPASPLCSVAATGSPMSVPKAPSAPRTRLTSWTRQARNV